MPKIKWTSGCPTHHFRAVLSVLEARRRVHHGDSDLHATGAAGCGMGGEG